jgi:hypothetical protein
MILICYVIALIHFEHALLSASSTDFSIVFLTHPPSCDRRLSCLIGALKYFITLIDLALYFLVKFLCGKFFQTPLFQFCHDELKRMARRLCGIELY